jgi:protoporphyrin/coproporphyrin ferrochelatase
MEIDKNGRGLIILNLGSPDTYQVKDVRSYLNEFLMDEKVIDINPVLRFFLVRGLISPFRAPKSAAAYKTVWTDRGSPLKVITEDFAALVDKKVNLPVAVAMRYGKPTAIDALKVLQTRVPQLKEVLLAPMYPHYAMSSYETAVNHAREQILSVSGGLKLTFLKPFYSEPSFIKAWAENIRPFLKEDYDGILFSYHGLPERHVQKTDPTGKHCFASGDCCEVKSIAWQFCYRHQVKETTRLVAESLGLDKNKVHISFQSRLGSDKWIEPYTDVCFQEFPGKGIKKLVVVSPAFVADCLETLEELRDRGKESFMEHGGEKFTVIPCLNTNSLWVDAFSNYVNGLDGEYRALWN